MESSRSCYLFFFNISLSLSLPDNHCSATPLSVFLFFRARAIVVAFVYNMPCLTAAAPWGEEWAGQSSGDRTFFSSSSSRQPSFKDGCLHFAKGKSRWAGLLRWLLCLSAPEMGHHLLLLLPGMKCARRGRTGSCGWQDIDGFWRLWFGKGNIRLYFWRIKASGVFFEVNFHLSNSVACWINFLFSFFVYKFLFTVCNFQLTVDSWQLTVDSWQLTVGNWQLAIRN